MSRPFSSLIALAAATSVVVAACAPTTADAQSRSQTTSSKEHQAILQEFGGVYTGPGNALVSKVAKSVAVQSGIASTGSQCTVTLLNSNVVNAFALPGCYVYVTRGLLSIMNDEAELASVLGHEIGHVAARHAQKRQSRATQAGIISVLAGIFGGSQIGQLANYLGTRNVLSFSRSQEFEADDLGIRYMNAAGYDPYASADMLESLEDESSLQVRMRGQQEADMAPVWARTHPLTADRVKRATDQARRTGVPVGAKARNTASYMAAVDGMLYGDDPTQGFVDDNVFAHPTLRLRFEAPQGFYMQNASDAVTVIGPNNARAQFSGGALQRGEDLESYAGRVLQALVGQARAEVGRPQRTTINGLEAVVVPARAATQSGTVDITIAAYRWDTAQAFHFVTLAPAGRAQVFDRMIDSFRRLSATEAAGLRPRIVDVVTVRQGDTQQSLANRMAFNSLKLERFRTINDLDANETLKPGQQVKIVVYGR